MLYIPFRYPSLYTIRSYPREPLSCCRAFMPGDQKRTRQAIMVCCKQDQRESLLGRSHGGPVCDTSG